MRRLRLYGKRECSLCDKAGALVRVVLARTPAVTLEYIDIEGDEVLFGRYGLRIPVLASVDSGAELDWPFDEGAIDRLLGNADGAPPQGAPL